MTIEFQAIGTIHSPYLYNLPIPPQPQKDMPGEFWITLKPEFTDGLHKLLTYRYLYIIYYLDHPEPNTNLRIHPSWAPEIEVGVFASRSPNRPNPIGLSIVELKGIEGNDILISGIDVYNGTPLLDLKPYIRAIDLKTDANDGWFDELEDKHHSIVHLLGIHHDHTVEHGHSHDHASHNHQYEHEHDYSHGHHLQDRSHSLSPSKTPRSFHLTRNSTLQKSLND
ncbi:tRNA (N6-threonylcarbamoyladenosine(37)-N6)-methyltransferase TrmO [Desulfitobacterium sp. AusDCA]|uniref:tRNA (N6-threonylcarbamoyladenosine(37)-N6)-methyltransferase TrmO n=1 Tax=Desulfitobacterium sp. AusDCA TaxID=3240383 RepID=UPI003DA715B2